MFKRLAIFAALYGALSLYWINSYDFRFFGLDELNVFVSFEKANDIEELIKFFFTPHNRHFIPLFKVFFYLEYVLFGPSPAPYHAVSIGLYAISTMLLWKFLLNETGDHIATLICTLIFAANTIYFPVISWVFLQSLILTLIFIQLSLVSTQKNPTKIRSLSVSAAFCLLASLCFIMGAAAWLFTAVYLGMRLFLQPRGQRPDAPGMLLRLLPLLCSAGITFISYSFISVKGSESPLASLVLDPLIILKGIVTMIGCLIVRTFRIIHLANLWIISGDTAFFFGYATIISFGMFLAVSIMMFKRLEKGRRATVLTGMILSSLTTAIVIAGSVGYYKTNVNSFIYDYARHSYFPFFFFLIGVSPYIKALGKRTKTVLLFFLPLLLAVHFFTYTNLFTYNSSRVDSIQRALSTVEASAKNPSSLPIRDKKIFQTHSMPTYKDLLYLFKDDDDIIVERKKTSFFLRNQRPIPPTAVRVFPKNVSIEGNVLRLSGSSWFTLAAPSLTYKNTAQHVSFKLKADRDSKGVLFCYPENGKAGKISFDIRKSMVHKLHVLPCPNGVEFSIRLEPGDYSIKEMRLHY
jgi:hypothetical protein